MKEKIYDFNKPMRNGTMVSRDAVVNLDNCNVPIDWYKKNHGNVHIGVATLKVEDDGLYAYCEIDDPSVYESNKWYGKILNRFKKWLGIKSPAEEFVDILKREFDQNISFSFEMKAKED